MALLKLEIDLNWRGESPLHVGSGALADSLSDKPLLKDSQGLPIVPGSAVRGKVRHACEQIARGLREDWPWPECHPPYQFCRGVGDLCPVCRLFGNEISPGGIRFGDLRLTFAPGVSVREGKDLLGRAGKPAIRWGVSLNRSRATAETDLLYNVETHFPNPAVTYRGVIRGNVAGETEAGARKQAALLVAGLRAVRALGGNRTRGLGWGRFEFVVRLDGEPADVETLLKEVSA